MRLAVLADIHGNHLALQAVLADLETAGGADHLWILGDLVTFGHDPVGCLQAIRALPAETTKVIRGNTDRQLIRGSRAPLPKPTDENWHEFATQVRIRDANYQWTLDRLGWEEMDYLLKLEKEIALEVENYGWVIGFHAVPGDDEQILLPTATDSEIRDALLDREGRLAFGGHTHRPMDRDVGTWRFVNPGSVGMPLDGDWRASYALITFQDGAAEIEIRRVPYDLDGVISALSGHPAREWIVEKLRPT